MTPKPPSSVGSRRFWAVLIASFLLAGLLPSAVLGAGETLSFTTNPAGATGGTAFATQPVVTINPAGAGGTVSLAIGTNPSAGTLSGCSAVYAAGPGTFTFSGCRIDKAGTGYTLVATWSGDGSVQATSSAFNVTVGSAAKLAFGVQPTNTAAGAAITPAVTVIIQDAGGNATAGTANVAMAIGTNPGGGTLGGTTTVAAVAGTATFSTLSINKSGTGYSLVASSTGLTSATSTLFNITAGSPSKLGFTVQPARGIPGIAFAVQPIVAVQDALGNTVTGDNTTLVTIAPSSGSLTCTGGPTQQASNGLAVFTGCRLAAAGVNFTLTATSNPSYTPATSAQFDVADQLAFSTQPSSTFSAGLAWSSQPAVAVRANSSTATHDQGTVVTLSIQAGTGATGATLSCTGGLSATAVNGIASFTGCSIDKVSPTSPSNPYKLVASAANLTSAVSSSVAITAGPATKLGFTAQPTSGVAAQAFPIQPIVAVQDAGGNTVLSGTNSNATITLSLGAAPAGAVLTCTGGNVKVAVAGLATFSGCMVNAAGTYTLVATATGLTTTTSSSFVVTAPAATITLTNSASVITWGNAVGLTIQFGQNGANKNFALQAARDGVNFVTIATLTTNTSGQATLSYRPATNLYYKAVFAGTLDLSAGTSNTTRTVVRQISLLRPTNFGAIKSIPRMTSITFTTTVRPSRPELPAAKVSFVFYRRVGSGWTFVTKRDVYINSLGKASTTFRFSVAGSWYVRSIANPTPYNANSVWSPVERYNVR
ncbi:MAG: hypothetical protein HY262_09495 [Chloroflexi bacterium]|nr:hypothetical protein [Chloroflexota bacterium]